MLRLGLKSGLHNETPRNKRLSHGMKNYGIGFTVNGIRSYEISSKFSGVEIRKHSHKQPVIRLRDQQSLKYSAVQSY